MRQRLVVLDRERRRRSRSLELGQTKRARRALGAEQNHDPSGVTFCGSVIAGVSPRCGVSSFSVRCSHRRRGRPLRSRSLRPRLQIQSSAAGISPAWPRRAFPGIWRVSFGTLSAKAMMECASDPHEAQPSSSAEARLRRSSRDFRASGGGQNRRRMSLGSRRRG